MTALLRRLIWASMFNGAPSGQLEVMNGQLVDANLYPMLFQQFDAAQESLDSDEKCHRDVARKNGESTYAIVSLGVR